jgi:hypothetical protein
VKRYTSVIIAPRLRCTSKTAWTHAADAKRQRTGEVRFQIYEAGYVASVAELRNAMGEQDFNAAWAAGAVLSIDEAIAYAQRGRGERKRPASGWASLTPTELDVVRLVSEGGQ